MRGREVLVLGFEGLHMVLRVHQQLGNGVEVRLVNSP